MLPLLFPQGFSQCLYNDDWPDAPCFDMGPASHQKFHDAWAPYYEYKGTEWMESKKIELNQALDNGIIEEWVEEIENYNVYRYYLSQNEIQSSLSYDSLFVRLDPDFKTRASLSDEDVCGPNTALVDGICTPDCREGTRYVDGVCFVDLDRDNSSYLALFLFSIIPVWFILSGMYFVFGKRQKKLIVSSLVMIGIIWILVVYTNTLPVSFG